MWISRLILVATWLVGEEREAGFPADRAGSHIDLVLQDTVLFAVTVMPLKMSLKLTNIVSRFEVHSKNLPRSCQYGLHK